MSKNEEKLTEKEIKHKVLRSEIIEHLISQKKVFFSHQQINDPDVTNEEKNCIAEYLLNKNIVTFLYRFGRFLTLNHLKFFENLEENNINGQQKEIDVLLNSFKKKINNKNLIKNRRYYAMRNKLIDYFSEKEMMSREPLLYDQLIGQFMTENEKRTLHSVDSSTCFSDVLLEKIHNEQVANIYNKQKNDYLLENQNHSDSRNSELISMEINSYIQTNQQMCENLFPQIPHSYRKHWGGFTDNAEQLKNKHPKYITSEEKHLLRKEFFGIMEANFIEGLESDFNYETVDNTSEYDDLSIQSMDEELYFESEEKSEEYNEKKIDINLNNDNISDDELDVYMKLINSELQ